MALMIVVPVVLPDEALPLADLEARVEAWGHALMRQGLAAAWEGHAPLRPAPPGPACGGAETWPAGHKGRKLETGFGPVWLARRRVRCAGCGRHFEPDDAVLEATLGAGRLSPRLRDLAARCGASWPYRQAAAVLGRLRGAPLSAETVRAVVGEVGAAVAAVQEAHAEAASAAPARPAAEPPPVPAALVVEMDGAWVGCGDTPRGTEVKVGVIHAGSEAIGHTRRRLRRRRYAATERGVATFEQLLTAAIEQRTGFAAPVQTLLGDGASWIWRLGNDALPEATKVLDRWHLREARRRARRAVLPDAAVRAPWSERLEDLLEGGDMPGALAALRELAAIAPHPALGEFAGYLTTLAPCIPDYTARRAAGERVGTGGVEKGGDLVVNRRCARRRGTRWWRDRLEGVTALRVALLNDDWDAQVAPTLAA